MDQRASSNIYMVAVGRTDALNSKRGFGGGSIKALRLNLSDLLCFSASRSRPADVLYQPKTTNLNEP